ncbi:MAG: hypothetical protein WBA46_16905, partial [Thermomicrobiales bacterium]
MLVREAKRAAFPGPGARTNLSVASRLAVHRVGWKRDFVDYLVFGVGFGSTLVLLGWVLRQFGPAMRYRDTPDEVLGAEQLLERNDWQRFCIAIGALLSVCGAVMLLVTLITLLIRPADRTGTIIVG